MLLVPGEFATQRNWDILKTKEKHTHFCLPLMFSVCCVERQMLVVSAGLISPIVSSPLPADPAPAAADPAKSAAASPSAGTGVATARTHHKKHGFGGFGYGGGIG